MSVVRPLPGTVGEFVLETPAAGERDGGRGGGGMARRSGGRVRDWPVLAGRRRDGREAHPERHGDGADCSPTERPAHRRIALHERREPGVERGREVRALGPTVESRGSLTISRRRVGYRLGVPRVRAPRGARRR